VIAFCFISYHKNKRALVNTEMNMQTDKELFDFLSNAPKEFTENEKIKKFQLKNGDFIHCVLWNMHFYITGTDIVKILVWRFQNAGRQIVSLKKFEEGVFSDLRNLKPGIDATLEGPRSDFLEFLYKNGCIRTQKKQKVFFWYSVPHDALFCDALERDLRRETNLYAYSKYYNKQAYPPIPNHFAKQFNPYVEQMNWQHQNIPNPHPVPPPVVKPQPPVQKPPSNPPPPFSDIDFSQWEEKYFESQVQMPDFSEEKTDEFVEPDLIIPNKKGKTEK
ncbi:putative Transcription factor, STE-like protein, partial [Trachipleistophora hominis]